MSCPGQCLDCSGPNTKASGHSGILEAAKAVLEDLQSTGTLQELMQEPPVWSLASQYTRWLYFYEVSAKPAHAILNTAEGESW